MFSGDNGRRPEFQWRFIEIYRKTACMKFCQDKIWVLSFEKKIRITTGRPIVTRHEGIAEDVVLTVAKNI